MRVLWGLRVSWLRDVRVRLTAVWGITRPLGSVDSIGCYGGGIALTQLAPLVGLLGDPAGTDRVFLFDFVLDEKPVNPGLARLARRFRCPSLF